MQRRRTPALTLGAALTGLAAALTASPAHASGILNASYAPVTTFTDALGSTTMTLAYDGTHYWSTSGGSQGGVREAEYSAAGAPVATFSPGLDFRSIFTDAAGNVDARQFADPTIYRQSTPGVFAPLLTLTGGSLDAQSSVVLNGADTEFVAMSGGTVDRWDTNGNFLGATTLAGFGTVGSEASYPQGRGIAAVGSYWLTYDGAGTLSAWDFSGNRVGEATLVGAGTSFDSDFSLSYANGQAFIADGPGGTWRGYDIGLGAPAPAAVPEPSQTASLGLGALAVLGLMVCARRRRTAAR